MQLFGFPSINKDGSSATKMEFYQKPESQQTQNSSSELKTLEPTNESKRPRKQSITPKSNENNCPEIDIKEEKMDAEDEPEADSSESELVIANVQSLQNVQQERGNYFSNISNYFYESYDKAGNQIYILVTFDSESVNCRQKSTNRTSILVASLRYLGRKLQNSLQMLTPSNI